MAFFGFSLLSCHFWPFTGVLRKIFGSLTREVWEFFKSADYPPSPDSYGGQAADVTDPTMGSYTEGSEDSEDSV